MYLHCLAPRAWHSLSSTCPTGEPEQHGASFEQPRRPVAVQPPAGEAGARDRRDHRAAGADLDRLHVGDRADPAGRLCDRLQDGLDRPERAQHRRDLLAGVLLDRLLADLAREQLIAGDLHAGREQRAGLIERDPVLDDLQVGGVAIAARQREHLRDRRIAAVAADQPQHDRGHRAGDLLVAVGVRLGAARPQYP